MCSPNTDWTDIQSHEYFKQSILSSLKFDAIKLWIKLSSFNFVRMFNIDSISTWLLGITVLFSITAFSDHQLRSKLMFNAFHIKDRNEFYRFLSSGFIHANWIHLLFNMIVLYYFGYAVEYYYSQIISDLIIAKLTA